MTVETGLSPAPSLAKNYKGQNIQVLAGTLDGLMADEATVPTLIKIDVEGAEHEVLQGATETLRKQPRLLIEVHRSALGNCGSSPDTLEEFLDGFGYRETKLTEIESLLGEYHCSLYLHQKS